MKTTLASTILKSLGFDLTDYENISNGDYLEGDFGYFVQFKKTDQSALIQVTINNTTNSVTVEEFDEGFDKPSNVTTHDLVATGNYGALALALTTKVPMATPTEQ